MTLKELCEKRQQIAKQMRDLNEKVIAEKRSFTAEEQQQWDTLNTEYEGFEAKEKELEAAESRSRLLADREKDLERGRGRRTEPDQIESRSQNEEERGKQTDADKAKSEARAFFQRYLRAECTRSEYTFYCEQRNLQADIPQGGGYLVMPEQMVNELVKFANDTLYIRQWATTYQVPMAASLGIPTLENDPSDADWTAEILTGNEDSTMSFGKRSLTPHPLAKRIKVSRKLLQMATVGAEALVRERLTYKFNVTDEKAFLTGSGAGQPLGVFTASNDGIPTGRDISTDNTSTAITADGLINCKFNLKEQYQNSPSTRWIFSRTGVRNIRKLKDGNGQYLWQAGLGGQPSTILEVPYAMSEYAPSTFTSQQYVGIIGDFRFYWIADALSMGIQRLDELYAATNQVGFIGRKETDGMPVLAEAFSRLQLA